MRRIGRQISIPLPAEQAGKSNPRVPENFDAENFQEASKRSFSLMPSRGAERSNPIIGHARIRMSVYFAMACGPRRSPASCCHRPRSRIAPAHARGLLSPRRRSVFELLERAATACTAAALAHAGDPDPQRTLGRLCDAVCLPAAAAAAAAADGPSSSEPSPADAPAASPMDLFFYPNGGGSGGGGGGGDIAAAAAARPANCTPHFDPGFVSITPWVLSLSDSLSLLSL